MNSIVFCAHEVPKIYEGFTGGFVDRLKGLSSAIFLSKLFRLKLKIFWRDPFPINNYFDFSEDIQFFDGDVSELLAHPKVNFLHKKFQEQTSHCSPSEFYASLENIFQSSNVLFFSNRECGELYRYFSSLLGSKTLDRIPRNGWDIFSQEYISISDRIRPKAHQFQSIKSTISIHFRVGGENLSWTDPSLYNEEKMPHDLSKLCNSLSDAQMKVRFKVFADNTRVRERAVSILREQGFEVYESSCEPVHLERSQGFQAAELGDTLREWVDIGDASFVVRTAGAFAAYAGKCRGIEVFNIDDVSSIRNRIV